MWYCWCCKGDDNMAKRAKGTGTLRKRKDGRWEGRLYLGKDENGKNKYKTVTSMKKSECQRKLDTIIEENEKRKRNEEHRYGDFVNPTVEEWSKIYIEDFCKGYLKPKTISGYESMIKNYINPYLGKYHLRDLTKLICQQYIMDVYENGRVNKKRKHDIAQGLSSRTVKDVKIVLHAVLEKAVDEGIIDKNPTDKLNMPKDRVKGMNPLSKEQSNRLLEEAFNSGCFEFYYLELTTGLRLGEILALEWDDLDINKRTITINKQVQRIDSVLQTETPKTKNSIRTIAISSDCASALARLKMRQAIGTTLMFPSPETGTYRDQNAVTRKFKRMLRRAGLPESTRFHDLRHTCATIALEEGVEIKALSSMLGHSDVAFTMNTYVHATKKLKTSAADKMEAAFEIGYSTVMNAQCGLKEA